MLAFGAPNSRARAVREYVRSCVRADGVAFSSESIELRRFEADDMTESS